MKKAYVCGFLSLILLAFVAVGVVRSFRNPCRKLTEASGGPFVYDGEIYVYSDLGTFPDERDTELLGFLQNTVLEAVFPVYEFLKAGELLPILIGDTEDESRAYLKVRTDRDQPAAKASELEESGAIDEVIDRFDEFVVWECVSRTYTLEELESSGYDHYEAFQRFPIEKEQIQALREQFPDALPRQEDFRRKNTVCLLLAGEPEMEDFLAKYFQGVYHISGMTSETDSTYWPMLHVGILFCEDGKVYYGNYDNEVTGDPRDVILEGLADIP